MRRESGYPLKEKGVTFAVTPFICFTGLRTPPERGAFFEMKRGNSEILCRPTTSVLCLIQVQKKSSHLSYLITDVFLTTGYHFHHPIIRTKPAIPGFSGMAGFKRMDYLKYFTADWNIWMS